MKNNVLLLLFLLGVWASSGFGYEAAAADQEVKGSTLRPAGWPIHLRFITGPAGGQWFTMGDPIAEVLSKDVLPTTHRQGGGLSNIKNIGNKLADVGFSLTCFLGAAQSGEEEYQYIREDNTILMTNVYPQVLYFLLRKDVAQKHGIKDVDDLLTSDVPIRFASLKPGTASEFILSVLLKYGYDTDFDGLRAKGWTVAFNNYAETADYFVAGELDCFAYTAGVNVPLIKTMQEHTEVLILPVRQDILDLLSEKFKTHTYTIKPGDYQGVAEPIKTLGDYTCIIVRKDLPDDLVFAVNKALWEQKDYIASIIADFGILSPDTALPAGLPAHPGSVKFWGGLTAQRP